MFVIMGVLFFIIGVGLAVYLSYLTFREIYYQIELDFDSGKIKFTLKELHKVLRFYSGQANDVSFKVGIVLMLSSAIFLTAGQYFILNPESYEMLPAIWLLRLLGTWAILVLGAVWLALDAAYLTRLVRKYGPKVPASEAGIEAPPPKKNLTPGEWLVNRILATVIALFMIAVPVVLFIVFLRIITTI